MNEQSNTVNTNYSDFCCSEVHKENNDWNEYINERLNSEE